MFISTSVLAQYTPSDLYQYNYTTISPSFAGLEGQKITGTANVYAFRSRPYEASGFIGYENKISKINSGVGFSADFMNYARTTRTNLNLLYNYQWSLDENRKVVAGAKITSSQLAFSHLETAILDPLHPMQYYGISRANTTVVGASVLYKKDKIFLGISVDNLFQKAYHTDNIALLSGYFDKQFNFIVGDQFRLGEKISTTHSIYVINKKDYWRFDLNNSVLIDNWLIAGLSLEVNNSDSDNQIYPKANAGFNVSNKAQFIFSAYSEANNRGGKKFSGQMMMMFNL